MLGPELRCVELNPEGIQQIIALKYELSPQALMNHITEKPEMFPTQKSTCHPCRIIADCVPLLSYANQNFIPWNLKCETDRN